MPRLSRKKNYLRKSKRTNRKSLKGGASNPNTSNANTSKANTSNANTSKANTIIKEPLSESDFSNLHIMEKLNNLYNLVLRIYRHREAIQLANQDVVTRVAGSGK